MLIPSARRTAMSSRSEKDRYLPDTGASSIGGIPPACRNHRDPTGLDTPHATAASSLVSPRAICTQNARSRSRRTGGRPGDSITARPVNAAAQPGGRPIESTSIVEVLRPPVEPGQYTSVRFGETLSLSGLRPSVGSVGAAYDDALAETTIGLYKNDCIRTELTVSARPAVHTGRRRTHHRRLRRWFGYVGDFRRACWDPVQWARMLWAGGCGVRAVPGSPGRCRRCPSAGAWPARRLSGDGCRL